MEHTGDLTRARASRALQHLLAGDVDDAAAFFVAQQAAKDAQSTATAFTGVDCDVVSGRWMLWLAGRIVGQVDDAELAWRLRPVLRDLAG